MVRIRLLLLLILLSLPHFCPAQSYDTVNISVNKKKLRVLSISSGIAYSATLVGLSELWYKNAPRQSFHFFNDNVEWKQVDKIGHVYSAFYTSYITSNALRSCAVSQKKSALIGALTGFMIMAPIEIMDGFSTSYGASTGDLLANAAGSSLFLLQSLTWKEIRVYPKFSFHRTNYASLRPNVLGENLPSEILKDYNGQTHWLSFDMDKFMQFPKWLNFAVGYGAQGMVYARDKQNTINNYNSYRQYYFSIDIDLTGIKTKSRAIKSLIFIANMIKIPSPTLQFSKNGIQFYALYF